MATGFIPYFIALSLLAGWGCAAAADVALVGVIGDKAAVLAIDGSDPKAVRIGQKWSGITVISVEKDRATVEIDGKRRVLTRGQHYRSGRAPSERQSATLAADAKGHFVGEGAVNGRPVRFLVDTGATTIALPAEEARRLGIDYQKGGRILVNTANGPAAAYLVKLDTVRLGEIELHAVDAVVQEQGLPISLLGMTFLNRVEMKRDGQSMTLIRRY
jgi:aspartyl protease family protein